MSIVVSTDWLADKMNDSASDIVVVDTRFSLKDADAGRRAYLEGHIPQAVYLDLNRDLSAKPAKHGGSHPLPDMAGFAAKIGHIGIDKDTTVVIYDEGRDMFAARLWWLLDYAGHRDVHVLDGGFEQWVQEGRAVITDIPNLTSKTFEPAVQKHAAVDIDDVQAKLQGQATMLIDSRARDRYLGQNEPRYRKAGHIPGAKNFVWANVFDEAGHWKTTRALQEHFASFDKDDEIIVSCGSGVSACPNVLALKSAGFDNVKLYPGSFSDWISYDNNPVETKEE